MPDYAARSILWILWTLSAVIGIQSFSIYSYTDRHQTSLPTTAVSHDAVPEQQQDFESQLMDYQLEQGFGDDADVFSHLTSVCARVAGLKNDDEKDAVETILRVALNTHPVELSACPKVDTGNLPGATGRVLLVEFQSADEEFLEYAQSKISLLVDASFEAGFISQPIMVKAETTDSQSDEEDVESRLSRMLKEHAEENSLRIPIIDVENEVKADEHDEAFSAISSQHIQIDGAVIQGRWDVSEVYVFDHIVSEDLCGELLEVVNGGEHDDPERLNPDRWQRGLLDDVSGDGTASCWGLTHDAIDELCARHHPAIQKLERIFQTSLFPEFVVSRLPESVFGPSVSPLTANAATHGDSFGWHIDADPNLVPPSPWCDAFGRYPNRAPGSPRFVSCLVYLNSDWDPEWGAPTRYRDPPTGDVVETRPRRGRVVVMDQDVTHTVVGPSEAAGNRPRYSLVWKLLLHPRTAGQDMGMFCKLKDEHKRSWPDALLVGSAARPKPEQ